MFKQRKIFLIIILCFMALLASTLLAVITVEPVAAKEFSPVRQSDNCPQTEGWMKTDLGPGIYEVPINAPAGQVIIGVCYKTATEKKLTDPLDPPVTSYTIKSTVWNKEECYTDPSANECNYREISHYSYKLADVPPTPDPASVSHQISCACNDQVSSHTITFTITGATVSLFDGEDNPLDTFTATGSSHAVEEGYYYTWVADATHTGSGGPITIGTLAPCCEPPKTQPSFVAEDPWCEWTGAKSIYHAEWTLEGALFSIFGDGYSFGPLDTNGNTILDLGMYKWSWENAEGYAEDGGGGTWDLTAGCEPGKGGVSLNHVCNYVDGESINSVNFTVNNATLTFNGKDYTEDDTLKLTPGEYPWSWVGVNENESGSGLLTLGTCPPKTTYEEPDYPAGGQGPNLVALVAPSLLAISGLTAAWILIRKRFKNTI